MKAWKTSGLNVIWTHDPWDARAVLYQLSYEANCKLVTLSLNRLMLQSLKTLINIGEHVIIFAI